MLPGLWWPCGHLSLLEGITITDYTYIYLGLYFIAMDTTVSVLHYEPLPETTFSRLRETTAIATSFRIIGNGSSGVVFPLHLSRNYQSNQNFGPLTCQFQLIVTCTVYEFTHVCLYTPDRLIYIHHMTNTGN